MRPKLWIAGLLLFGEVAITGIEGLADSSPTDAATHVALVSTDGNGKVDNVLDTATVLLSKDADLKLLERTEVNRILHEQNLLQAGIVRAEDAVKAGQLLHVDLFAVLEGATTNGRQASFSLGLVVFDAKTGV